MKLKKIISPGTGDCGRVFVEVEISMKGGKERLSMVGVEGPKSNGDCMGGCGQCVDALDNLKLQAEWSLTMVRRLKAIWERWHLNDMRAGCEHQRAIPNYATRDVEVIEYRLTSDARKARAVAEQLATDAAINGEASDLTEQQKALLATERYITTHNAPDADSLLSGCFEVSKREMKKSGWVKASEHPSGVLCLPCEECGYPYGSKWLYEPIPDAIVAELEAFPDATVPYPWGKEAS